MFNPLTVGAASAFGMAISSTIAPAFVPWQRLQTYRSNSKDPNLVPPPDVVTRLGLGGLIADTDMFDLLGLHGISMYDDPNAGEWKSINNAWAKARELQKPTPSLQELMEYYGRGSLSRADFVEFWKRLGTGQDRWEWMWDVYKNRMSVADCLIVANRELRSDAWLDSKLKHTGIIGKEERELYNRLREVIPGYQDLIRFAVRDVYDTTVSGPQKLFEGYPSAQLEPWLRSQGLHGQTKAINPHTGKEATWGELYWAAHWMPISPTQSYQMVRRIRSNNLDKWNTRGFSFDKPFTVDDVKTWLKISDYPEGIRPHLAAVSYNVLTRRDVKELRKQRLLSSEEVVQSYEDMGHPRDDAEKLGAMIEGQVGIVNQENKEVLREALRSYRLGVMSKQSAKETYMNGWSGTQFQREEAVRMFESLVVSIDIAVSNDNIERAIKALRLDFLEGAVTKNDTQAQLRNMGIAANRIEQYVSSWSIDFTRPRRIASTKKIQAWYCDGLITRDEASSRLTNIGWSDADRFLYLTESDRCVSEKNSKAAMQAAKTEEQKAREIDKAMSRQRAEQKRLLGEYRKINSPARLGKWYRDESISLEEARERLGRIGWNDGDIDRWVSEQTYPKTPTVVEGEGI